MDEISTNQIITEIMSQLTTLTTTECEKIQNILNLEFSKYNFSPKKYEICLCNNNERLIKEYLCYLKLGGKSERTIKQYLWSLKTMLVFLNNKDLLKVTSKDLKDFYTNYAITRKVSNTTIGNLQRCISPFFLFLEKEEYIQRNPCIAIAKPKITPPQISPFTGEELEQLREDVYCKKQNQTRNRALLEFFIATGCRVSECAAVKISDIDFKGQSVKILGKGNKERTVFFTGQCLKHLKDYLNERSDQQDVLFYSSRTKQGLSKSAIERIFRNIETDGKYHIHCNPHRFRHTFAQTCIDRGMPVEDVAFLMGHESVKTTINRYYKKNDNKLRVAYNKYVE